MMPRASKAICAHHYDQRLLASLHVAGSHSCASKLHWTRAHPVSADSRNTNRFGPSERQTSARWLESQACGSSSLQIPKLSCYRSWMQAGNLLDPIVLGLIHAIPDPTAPKLAQGACKRDILLHVHVSRRSRALLAKMGIPWRRVP